MVQRSSPSRPGSRRRMLRYRTVPEGAARPLRGGGGDNDGRERDLGSLPHELRSPYGCRHQNRGGECHAQAGEGRAAAAARKILLDVVDAMLESRTEIFANGHAGDGAQQSPGSAAWYPRSAGSTRTPQCAARTRPHRSLRSHGTRRSAPESRCKSMSVLVLAILAILLLRACARPTLVRRVETRAGGPVQSPSSSVLEVQRSGSPAGSRYGNSVQSDGTSATGRGGTRFPSGVEAARDLTGRDCRGRATRAAGGVREGCSGGRAG